MAGSDDRELAASADHFIRNWLSRAGISFAAADPSASDLEAQINALDELQSVLYEQGRTASFVALGGAEATPRALFNRIAFHNRNSVEQLIQKRSAQQIASIKTELESALSDPVARQELASVLVSLGERQRHIFLGSEHADSRISSARSDLKVHQKGGGEKVYPKIVRGMVLPVLIGAAICMLGYLIGRTTAVPGPTVFWDIGGRIFGPLLIGAGAITAAYIAFDSAKRTRDQDADHHRVEAEFERESALRERYVESAKLLSDDRNPSVREAGVYALAALADDWSRFGEVHGQIDLAKSEIDVCVSLLCSYLRANRRMKDVPSPEASIGQLRVDKSMSADERSVRETICQVLAERLGEWRAIGSVGSSSRLLDLRNADLQHADLANADLRAGVLANTDLSGAILNNADLSDAVLVSSTLTGAWLRGANLRAAVLIGAKLTRADLTDANLTGAFLSGLNTEGYGKHSADLASAVLMNANLSGADLRGVNMAGAKLAGANLRNANVTAEQLATALLSDSTILPSGALWSEGLPVGPENGDLSGP
jgi:uncharacterized protein YjbI with pentapeptide repeats